MDDREGCSIVVRQGDLARSSSMRCPALDREVVGTACTPGHYRCSGWCAHINLVAFAGEVRAVSVERRGDTVVNVCLGNVGVVGSTEGIGPLE
jgi:hypothetical protein